MSLRNGIKAFLKENKSKDYNYQKEDGGVGLGTVIVESKLENYQDYELLLQNITKKTGHQKALPFFILGL